MTRNLTEQLDEALARQNNQESTSEILADFPEEADALRPFLNTAAALETLQLVEYPDEAALAADRAIFMTHVGNLPPLPVSPSAVERLKGWMANSLPSIPIIMSKKEYRPMGALLLKAILVFTLMFGAAGGTAALSSASQPDSPFYPLKLGMEQARLGLAEHPAEQAGLHLAFAQERAEEMAHMARRGTPAEEAVETQLRNQWQQALRLMAQSPEEAMMSLLAQAELMAQQQLEMLQAAAGGEGQNKTLAQVTAAVAFGIQEPQAFRQMGGDLTDLFGGPNGPGDGEPVGPGQDDPPGNGEGGPNGPGDGVPNGPGEGDGNGAGPGGPNGPGEGDCEIAGECDGDGPHGPQGEGGYRPGPGGPNGPGEGECETTGECDGDGPHGPQGPGNEENPGPGPEGPNGPGEGECDTPGECDGDGPHGPQGPGEGEPNGPGNTEAPRPGPGPGGPNGPGDGEPDGPGEGGGDGPGPGEPNGPGDGDGDGDGNQNGDDNGQNGDDNGQNGGDNGENGGNNGENGGDNGENGGDNGGDNGENGGDNGENGGDNGENGGDNGENGGGTGNGDGGDGNGDGGGGGNG